MSAAPSPIPSPLRPEERRRVRRIVRWALMAVVGIEALTLTVAAVPEAEAFTVYVTNMFEATMRLDWINSKLGITNNHLQAIRQSNSRIESHTDRVRELAEQHSTDLGGSAWDPELAAVTSTPSGELYADLSFAQSDAATNLEALIPGAVPWKNYHQEYAASADATLLTLRSSLAALNKHYEQIEDDSRLRDLARQAHSANSYLAMDELQVQSQLEVARQLHALRAQQALSTNLYAVAESHRIGAEARTKAKDAELDCSVLAAALGGAAGVVVSGIAAEAALC